MFRDESPFIEQLRQEPANNDIRLVYADWLEDRGELDRAEFLRVELELDQLRLESPEFCDAVGRLFATIDRLCQEPAANLLHLSNGQLVNNWTTCPWMERVRLRYEFHTAHESNLAPHPIGKLSVIRQLQWLRRQPLRTLKRAAEASPHRYMALADLENVLYLREVNQEEPAKVESPGAAPFCQLRVQRRSQPLQVDEIKPLPSFNSNTGCRRQTCQRWFQVAWRGEAELVREFLRPHYPQHDAAIEADADAAGRHWFAIANAPVLARLSHKVIEFLGGSHRRSPPLELFVRPVYLGRRQIARRSQYFQPLS